ncbi:DEAD/DEAH box helicase [Chondromyces apiculatus]|uniref:Helicase, SNF2/RAD54 family n=1 Tax=Chondromyces apiculatus DSM 436 TaxID=1192034 RepID=A0A017SVB9_9BACT|nr:DEAD/DEAH box helicase [Chondromyces apiculatus]EYF00707.1 Helicase, SNF2/RAD54 family [Chondromyces apiculatus DSM 436]
MPSPISDALSTLSDRGLRRLLGARTFLRGLEYFRRRVVEDISLQETSATGTVRAADSEPYGVRVELTPDGIKSQCSCPAFQKAGQHCKHVAALLITVRDHARGSQPRREPPPAPAILPQTAHAGGANPNHEALKRVRRRDRRGRVSLMPAMPVQPAAHQSPSVTAVNLTAPAQDATARQTGIGAWLPPEGVAGARRVEFRLHVRQGALTVTVLDAEARVPVLPSAALSWQAVYPSPDRDALRLLSRFESGNPRHPAVDIRGEDVAELLPLLEGQRVLLEPALMQLRFSEDVLRPRFDLETVGGDTIIVKASFERPNDRRRFSLLSGGWFEGWPGWHIDTQEGIARRVDRRVSPAAMRRLLRSPTIGEPMAELPRIIMQGLPKIALEVGAELPDLGQIADVVDLVPTFRMRAGGSLMEAQVSLFAAYGDAEVAVRADGITLPVIVQPPEEGMKRARCVRLDIAAQQEAANKLLSLGLQPDESGQGFTASGDNALRFWTDGLGELPDDWDLFVPEDLVDTQVRGKPISVFAKVTSGIDWLNVKLSFESEGLGVDREELRRCLAQGKRYVRLEDGSFAPFDPDAIRAMLDREIELLTVAGKGGRIPLAQAGRVQELLQHTAGTSVSAGARELFHKLSSLDEISSTKKPRALKATLRPYQEAGLSWLKFIHDIGSGGVLADDMGLGKTVQTIALLLAVKQESKHLRALIVAPTSVVINWERELERFAPSASVALWHGADRKEQIDAVKEAEVVITSYALLRRDEDFLTRQDFDYAILDEAQHIKNPLSATAAAAKRLKAKRRLALTGTPIENRLSEIWSIFDFVSPGLLGPLDKFEQRFSRPIEAGDYKTAQRLRAVIHPFILRRTKSEVARDLPEKIETDQICDLTGEQRAMYLNVAREVRAQVMGEVERVGLAKSQIQILAGLTRLRQAACDPRLLGLPRDFTDEDSGKLVALRELVSNAVEGGHKVLIFSQFVMMLKIIEKAMKEDGVAYEYLDGSTKDRMDRVERFQNDPSIPLFLISLKAGGTGLNLTAADTVIHFDPWWNPAVEQQATDRAHRIGQTKVVTAYRLVAAGTIEEKILQLKAKKKELVASVLSEDVGGAKKLTKSDLEELFSVD